MLGFPTFEFPLDKWIDSIVAWLTVGWRFEFFRAISSVILWALVRMENFLLWLPPGAVILAFALVAWWTVAGRRTLKELAIVLAEAGSIAAGLTLLSLTQNQEVTTGSWSTLGYALLALSAVIALALWIFARRHPGLTEIAIGGLVFIGIVGLWEAAMTTLAVVGVATVISISLAIPIGIAMAKSDFLESAIRPVLDAAQTMPSFVYLVPALMLFGLGKVPAVIATVIYAVPPGIRLTNLGIRLVAKELIEVARAFGTTSRQMLFYVELPLALPNIMAGVNQTIMAALSMVVIASLVGAAGLGREVMFGIARLRVGHSFNSGISIVILAVVIDRVTQALARPRRTRAPSE